MEEKKNNGENSGPEKAEQKQTGLLQRIWNAAKKAVQSVVGYASILAARVLLGKQFSSEMRRLEMTEKTKIIDEADKIKSNNKDKSTPKDTNEQEKKADDSKDKQGDPERNSADLSNAEKEKGLDEQFNDYLNNTIQTVNPNLKANSCFVSVEGHDGYYLETTIQTDEDTCETPATKVRLDEKGNVEGEISPDALVVSSAYCTYMLNTVGSDAMPDFKQFREVIKNAVNDIDKNPDSKSITIEYYNTSVEITKSENGEYKYSETYMDIDGSKFTINNEETYTKKEITSIDFVGKIRDNVFLASIEHQAERFVDYISANRDIDSMQPINNGDEMIISDSLDDILGSNEFESFDEMYGNMDAVQDEINAARLDYYFERDGEQDAL